MKEEFQIASDDGSINCMKYICENSKITFVFHHGAGYSLNTFQLAQETLFDKGFSSISFDARGHGQSKSKKEDLSMENFLKDLEAIIRLVSGEFILVGHSLGGAVVSRFASEKIIHELFGLVIVDIVEETAIKSLALMPRLLEKRPKTFQTEEQAIEWHSTVIKNRKSAEISVPSILVKRGELFTWRVDLIKSRSFLPCWFTDLTRNFLTTKATKMVILSELDRLDKGLMIAQMQGKFQLEIISDSGHLIQEDQPERFAYTLIECNKLI